MKIGESSASGHLGAAPAPKPGDRRDNGASGPRSVTDVASIAGLGESELSPAVRAALATLMEEVERLRRELDRSRRRIEYLERLADEDTLLPVANRRAFVRELSRMMSFGERYGITGSVLYFDVNHLKRINDEHGHAAGDAALRKIAEVLLANVRGSDLVGRLGGDEFGVILTQADEQTAREKAAALAQLIADTALDWEGAQIPLSVAYGMQPLTEAAGADDALNAADKEMYRQKRGQDGSGTAG